MKTEKVKFEVGLRKLLGISTKDLDVESIGQKHEELIQIPRENSSELRKLDPLWEALQPKISILEERALLSPNFNLAKNEMNTQKAVLFSDIDVLLNSWNTLIANEGNQEQIVVQILLVIDIAVFFLVLYVIRQSLLPLRLITDALSGIKEGMYGEKVKYTKSDEVGKLVNTFNVMSETIKEKEEQTKKTEFAKDEFLAMIQRAAEQVRIVFGDGYVPHGQRDLSVCGRIAALCAPGQGMSTMLPGAMFRNAA